MPATLKIEHARFALTLDAERRIIQDASILIEGQRITRIGKADELADVGADRVIDGRRFVVTPGYFNGHMHISYAHAVRGIFPDDLANRLFHVFNLQSAMTEEEEYLTTQLGILEMLQNGTTSFLDPGTTRFPDACFQAYADSGIRVFWAEQVTDLPAPVKLPRWEASEAVARTATFIDTWHGKLDGRMQALAMAFSCETASAELLQGLKRLVDEKGVTLTLHHQSGDAERRKESNTITTNLRHIRPPVERPRLRPGPNSRNPPKPENPNLRALFANNFDPISRPIKPPARRVPNAYRAVAFQCLVVRSNPDRLGVRDQAICEHGTRHIAARQHPRTCVAVCCCVMALKRFMVWCRGSSAA